MNLNIFIRERIVESYGLENPVCKYLSEEMLDRWINEWYETTFRKASPTWLSQKLDKNFQIKKTESRIINNGK